MKVGLAYKQGAGGLPANMQTKETPVSADKLILLDSEDGNKPKLIEVGALLRATFALAAPLSTPMLDTDLLLVMRDGVLHPVALADLGGIGGGTPAATMSYYPKRYLPSGYFPGAWR